jgi:hypothetical protein
MSDYGLEFPHYSPVRDNMFSTLEKLQLYSPEHNWEDLIMAAYQRSLKNFGAPTNVFMDPKAFKSLSK